MVLHFRRLLMHRGGGNRRRWRQLGDAAAVVLCYLLELLLSWDKVSAPHPGGAALVPWLVALLYVPLLFRRSRPAGVFAAVAAGSAAMSVLVPGFVPLFSVWLALYAAALLCRRSTAIAAAAAACALIALNTAVEVGRGGFGQDLEAATVGALGGVVITLAVFGLGRWVAWSVEQRRLAARHAAERAIREERSRIARELHDVVAHAVSLMVLQSAGAARVMQANPEQAAAALENVALLGNEAVVELRRMLGLLHEGPAAASAARGDTPPQHLPGLSRLGPLLRDAEQAGIRVHLRVTGDPVPLEPGVDVSAYRVVQEALTNASRYAAPGHTVSVFLHWQASGVRLEVRNRCAPERRDHPLSTGHGLIGMAERVKAADGRLDACRRGDEFVVEAAFPGSNRPAGPEPAAGRGR
ncbi:sensor histidine kinase [Pseudarthrobacter sp. NPDC092439]|uniref:sensor histidine kinase n=1 Tax=unclassified Pseudarthrobacter TaxID=2647000 RepID=UPI003807527C